MVTMIRLLDYYLADSIVIFSHRITSSLVLSLKTAREDDGVSDKEETSFDDQFDGFRLCLQNIKFKQ